MVQKLPHGSPPPIRGRRGKRGPPHRQMLGGRGAVAGPSPPWSVKPGRRPEAGPGGPPAPAYPPSNPAPPEGDVPSPWTSAGGRLKPFKSGRPRKPVALRIADPLGRARAERKPQAPSYPMASFGWDKVGQNNPPAFWAGGPHREREVWGGRAPPASPRARTPRARPLDRPTAQGRW